MSTNRIAISVYSEEAHLQAELPATNCISYVPSSGFETSLDWRQPDTVQFRMLDAERIEIWDGNVVRPGSPSDVFQIANSWICAHRQLEKQKLRIQPTQQPKAVESQSSNHRHRRPPSLDTLEQWFETLGIVPRQPNDMKP